ncbi:delta(8)-fatty-acid desaturase 2 [Cucumis melo var. makuwa]|uniref:Delta(8)-fatty-acid desaturase 2 n=2 Tax=Cucumis melo TaxID=3656 RepID=A0A1S3C7C0_CUCME|nr:delta(8)-fatty-acid desaturase 2 [Cucumis melo]TYK14028.1 delta(8)-fatty-acid desaturase 2 [Cucumis melo var. makuwa]
MEVEKKYITSEELLKHNKPGDLWISIQGKVYNVTEWAKVHPGGDTPFLNLAGHDVTDAFIAYHPGTAWAYLDRLFTGFHLKDFQVSEISKDYRKLASEFSKQGLFEKKGHVIMYSLISVAVMMFLVVYGVLKSESVLVHLGCAMILGMLWIQSAYVGHDSGHSNVMSSRGFNKLAQILSGNCLTGISIAWWKWTHNAHHISCNSLDHDPDLQHIPVFAVSATFFRTLTSHFYGRKLKFDSLARFFVSYQHFTFYPVMCVARVNLFVQTLLLLFSTRKVPDRALNIMGILVFWTWFPLLVSYLPNWPERVMFVLASFAVCSLQHIQFCLNHFSANVYVGKPTGNDWFEKQTSGTLDISCSSWMDWFFGGLQFQLEHHLFPRMPRCQLRKISPIVVELCKKHNLPYRSLSFWDANVRTIRTLRTAALQARDLTNPVPKNLLWEAVNTHG